MRADEIGRHAVEAVHNRKKMQQTVKRADGAAAEQAQLDQNFEKAKTAFAAAEQKWLGTVVTTQARNAELAEIIRQADVAKGQLQATCQDEALRAEVQSLDDEVRELSKRQRELTIREKAIQTEIEIKGVKVVNAHGKAHGAALDDVAATKVTAEHTAAERELLAGVKANILELGEVREAIDQKKNAVLEKMATAPA